MKEITAYVHRSRVVDALHALKTAGFSRLSFVDVKGMLGALDAEQRVYSLELGNEVITEVKIDLVCHDERVDEAIELLQEFARADRGVSGWVFVSSIDDFYIIEGKNSP